MANAQPAQFGGRPENFYKETGGPTITDPGMTHPREAVYRRCPVCSAQIAEADGIIKQGCDCAGK